MSRARYLGRLVQRIGAKLLLVSTSRTTMSITPKYRVRTRTAQQSPGGPPLRAATYRYMLQPNMARRSGWSSRSLFRRYRPILVDLFAYLVEVRLKIFLCLGVFLRFSVYRCEDLPKCADALAEDVPADELANVFGPAGGVPLLNALIEKVQQVVRYARDLDDVGLGSLWHL